METRRYAPQTAKALFLKLFAMLGAAKGQINTQMSECADVFINWKKGFIGKAATEAAQQAGLATTPRAVLGKRGR